MGKINQEVDFFYEPPCQDESRGRVALFLTKKGRGKYDGEGLRGVKKELKEAGWSIFIASFNSLPIACSMNEKALRSWFRERLFSLIGESKESLSIFSDFSLFELSLDLIGAPDSMVIFCPEDLRYSPFLSNGECFSSLLIEETSLLFIVESGGDISRVKSQAFSRGLNCFFYEYDQQGLFSDSGNGVFLEDMLEWVELI